MASSNSSAASTSSGARSRSTGADVWSPGVTEPRRGRRTFLTGDDEQKPELYFTLHERGATYGPVIVRDNLYVLGAATASPAVTFAPGGHDLVFSGNTFQGAPAVIRVDPSCRGVAMEGNRGATVERAPVDFHHGRR